MPRSLALRLSLFSGLIHFVACSSGVHTKQQPFTYLLVLCLFTFEAYMPVCLGDLPDRSNVSSLLLTVVALQA